MSAELASSYHDRFHVEDYDTFYRNIPEAELTQHEATSPFDVWATVKLRAKFREQEITKIPTEIMVWGRGEPKVPAGTKVGGLPAWPQGRPLPSANRRYGLFPSQLRFFAQFNFMDSLDLVPKLPAGLLSVWFKPQAPWEAGSIQAFWIDPAIATPADEPNVTVERDGVPIAPFFAELYRTWDPAPDQDIEPLQVDHQFESCRSYIPRRWTATKIGGLEAMSQWGSAPKNGHFILQFASIQAACDVPYPFINHPESLSMCSDEGGINHPQNSVILGDLGSICFCLRPNGSVKAIFECG